MDSQDDSRESKRRFREKMANRYGFFGKWRDVFLSRFDEDNANKKRKAIAESLWIDEEIVNREQTFQDHLTVICEKLAENGCPIIKPHGRGQPRKGESPWEQAFKWLWDTKFPEWLALRSSDFSSPSTAPINWHQICRQVLAEQQKHQRLRRKATERGFELNVYVPLGLVERKQQQRRSGDVPLEQVYQLSQEVITKEYQHDDFLKDVIAQSQNTKSKHIAIVGEPGAGKTTLLGEIAADIQKNDKGLPICIPLRALQEKTLKDYLLQNWLEAALPFIDSEAVRVTSAIREQLKKLFRESRVWLLLDGVDEIAVSSPVEALTTIQAQLTDWACARVVLTCRLNVWDASVNNTLSGFDTYQTLDFTDNQVQEFIQAWFESGSQQEITAELKSLPQLLGEQLQTKLKESGRDRIRELVKNPLRLSLLCQTFYLDKSGELPDTKAKLYSRFARYFYEWKQNQLEITRTQRRELHQALGKLALAGINSAARFRLGEDLACKVMGERLFKLACDLGWLNLVDREAGTEEPVYAFFHPTFQEYFAACAIADWHDFLNSAKGVYRIFEPQWKEVILLWLGLEDVEKEQKKAFIKALVDFEDGCEDFYRFRAYFLAAAGIAEFRDCPWSDEIVAQIVKWGFGYFNNEKQEWVKFLDPIAEAARAALQQTNRPLAVTALSELIRTSQNEDTRRQAADGLGQFGMGYPEAVVILIKLIRTSQDEDTRRFAIFSLGDIGMRHPEAIAILIDLIKNSQDRDTRDAAVSSLQKISMNHPEAMTVLNEQMHSSHSKDNCSEASDDPSHSEAITDLIDLIRTSVDEDSRRQAVFNLVTTNPDQPEAIPTLIELIRTSPDWHICCLAAEGLGRVAHGNTEATVALIELICNTPDWFIRKEAARSLGQILQIHQLMLAITALKDYLTDRVYENDFDLFKNCYQIIWHCAQNMSYPAFYKAWHSPPSTHLEVLETTGVGYNPLTQRLNLAELPKSLLAAINNNPYLRQTIHLICIDGSKFIDRDNPAAEIYDQMLDQDCPERQQGEPETMQALKVYWNSLRRRSDRTLVLLFYENPAGSPPQGFSHTVLDALSRFDGAICVVTGQLMDNIPLQQFSAEQTELVENIVGWIRAIALET